MKEIVTYVAIVMMEFNEEAVCDAFYKNYKSSNGLMLEHTAECAKVITFEYPEPLRYGHLDDLKSPPLPRPIHKFFKEDLIQ